MISREQFADIIETIEHTNDYLDKTHDLGIDLYETPLVESFYKLESTILKDNFSEEDVDTIYWWLYEYENRSEPGMWDNDGKVIPMETLDDLCNYIYGKVSNN